MARKAVVEDTVNALHQQYRAEPVPEVRTRLHALWLLLRRGEPPAVVVSALGTAGGGGGHGGVCDGTGGAGLDQGAVWGGLHGEQHVHAVAAAGDPASRAGAGTGALSAGPPGPRDLEKRWVWGASGRLRLDGGQGTVWGDEVRVGLWNAVRKTWAPRGVEVSREVQINRQYTYVAVALDPRTGWLWWIWQENMKGEEMARIRGDYRSPRHRRLGPGWGRQPQRRGHAGHRVAPGGTAVLRPRTEPRGTLLPGAAVGLGDRVYPTLEAKRRPRADLRDWQVHPEWVRPLCSWDWIRNTLTHLPADTVTP